MHIILNDFNIISMWQYLMYTLFDIKITKSFTLCMTVTDYSFPSVFSIWDNVEKLHSIVFNISIVQLGLLFKISRMEIFNNWLCLDLTNRWENGWRKSAPGKRKCHPGTGRPDWQTHGGWNCRRRLWRGGRHIRWEIVYLITCLFPLMKISTGDVWWEITSLWMLLEC